MKWRSVLLFDLAIVYVIQTYEVFVVLQGLSVEHWTRFKKKKKKITNVLHGTQGLIW